MKYIIKGLVICVCAITMATLGWKAFAQSTSSYDCGALAADDYLLYPTAVKRVIQTLDYDKLEVFTDKDLRTSLTHVQSYCCEIWQIAKEICEEKSLPLKEKIYTESPYLADHLMYVGMKKLDWNQEHCDVLWIDCQPESYDVDPVERRDDITEIAEDVQWYPPSIIHQKFIESRWEARDLVGTTPYTLSKAYRAMCNDLSVIIQSSAEDGGVSWLLVGWWKSVEELCLERVSQRYVQESQYVRLLMLEKGRTYFIDNIASYVNNYFLDSRMQWLMWKYATLDGCFASVLRYVQKTSCCNE